MQTVKVRVRKPTRVLTFLAKDLPLRRDDKCIVRSDRGLEFGICIMPPEDCLGEDESRFKMQVVRMATDQDEVNFFKLQEEEKQAARICAQKIADRKLAMKLVDTEFTFDKNKIVFYFTAADRVDFRDLVRDLAHDLKTRIELRHIQVRDEAKIVGGLGVCGRELCCSTWLTEFQPISMKMAKRQNLSLNPSKISGQCGRLLCCLAYENDLYQDEKQRRRREASGDAPKPADAVPAEPRAEAPREERPARQEPPRREPRREVRAAEPVAVAEPAASDEAAGADEDKPRRRRRRRGRRGTGSGEGGAPASS